jgi:hypothetical protein
MSSGNPLLSVPIATKEREREKTAKDPYILQELQELPYIITLAEDKKIAIH